VPAPAGFIDSLALTYLQNNSSIKPVLQRIFTSSQFTDPSVYFTRYAWPVEFVVRAMKETGWTGFSLASVLTPLLSMGQQLFEPPDVSGWALGQAWFSTGAMLNRMNFASTLASNQKIRLATAASVAKQSPQAVANYMLTRLTPSDVSGAVYNDLVAYAGAVTSWTGSDAQLQAKAPGLAHLILGSAEYQFV